MFVIHHIEGRRSERVAWLCEELGLPYRLEYVPGDVMGSLLALEKAHPMRMAPTLEDGAVRIVESGGILEYILGRYGEGRLRPPPESPAFPDYCQWMHFAEGTGMFRGMMERLAIQLAGDAPPPDVSFLYIGSSARVLRVCEAALTGKDYFAGDSFTAADIMMHFPLRMTALASVGVIEVTPLFHNDRRGLEPFPKVAAFVDRMAARPAFQRAMQTTMPNGPPPA